jgi:Uma2 family endonuclease
MSSSAFKKKTAYEKWQELPENVVGEIIAGDLHVSPRPTPKHSNSASGVVDQIRSPFHHGKGGPGGWIILFEPEVHLDNNITVPDIAGWKRQRMPKIPDAAFFSMAPDWICEVLSPSTAILDRAKKMPLYAQQGVKHFWLVDPIALTLEVYQNDHFRWSLLHTYAENEKIHAVPFDAIEIDLSALWS